MDLKNVLELVVILIIFVAVLAATYFVTIWLGKSGMVQAQSKNIKIIEAFKIDQNKYIQIIQIGNKYYSIAISKDNITFISELDEEQLDLSNIPTRSPIQFQTVLDKIKKTKKDKIDK